MANSDKEKNLVDISSGTQIRKVYNKKGRARRIVCIVLSVILLIGGSGMIYVYSLLDSLQFKDISDDSKTTNANGKTDSSGFTVENGDILQDSKVLNIMLFGEDNHDGEEHGRSDTMIMASIDNRHKKLKLTSFQRDTYVFIPGHDYDKINASYTLGGAKLSIQTIEANFGVKVDRYAVVDFDSFMKIIDTLGGIDMQVTQDEIDYINYQMYKNEQADTPTTITDPPGVVHLTGQEALWYARNRGLSKGEDGNTIGIDGDDWDRTSRQRKLIETVFESMKGADLGQIISIVSSIGPLVTTNLKKDEITALVSHALGYLEYDVEQYYVPEEGLWYYDDDTPSGSVIRIADMQTQRVKFAEFIYEDLVNENTATTTAQ